MFFWLYDDDDGYDISICFYVFPLLFWAMCLLSSQWKGTIDLNPYIVDILDV